MAWPEWHGPKIFQIWALKFQSGFFLPFLHDPKKAAKCMGQPEWSTGRLLSE
jgi:hypothetical protein